MNTITHKVYTEECRRNTVAATKELAANNTGENRLALELCYQEEEDATYSWNELREKTGESKEEVTFKRTLEHKTAVYNQVTGKELTEAEHQEFCANRPKRKRA